MASIRSFEKEVLNSKWRSRSGVQNEAPRDRVAAKGFCSPQNNLLKLSGDYREAFVSARKFLRYFETFS